MKTFDIDLMLTAMRTAINNMYSKKEAYASYKNIVLFHAALRSTLMNDDIPSFWEVWDKASAYNTDIFDLYVDELFATVNVDTIDEFLLRV